MLDEIFGNQRKKCAKQVDNFSSYYQRWPKLYDPLEEDTFMLSVNYLDQKNEFKQQFADRLTHRRKLKKEEPPMREFDSLKRDPDTMTFA